MFDATVAGGGVAVVVFTVLRFQDQMVEALAGTTDDTSLEETERR